MIAMDFMSGLPRTSSGYDDIWVIVDRLTKTAYFLPIKKTYSTDKLARLYVSRIVCLHGALYLIEDPPLLQSFGKSCIKLWKQDWISAQFFILRQMVSLKEPFKLWRICFACA